MEALETLINLEDGIQSVIYELADAYRVIFRDMDAEENIEVRNFPTHLFTLEKVVAYAKKLTA